MDEIKSESKQIQQDYLEILNDILQKVMEKGQFQGADVNKDISIFVGKQLQYKGNPHGEVSINLVKSDLVEQLQKAINSPQELKGSVRIMIGKDKAFHVKDGKVIADKLGLATKTAQNLTTSQTKNVAKSPQKSPVSIKDLQSQVDTLQRQVEAQQKVIDNFSNQQQKSPEEINSLLTEFNNLKAAFDTQQRTIEQLQKGLAAVNNRNIPHVQNQSLKDWIGKLETNVKKSAQGLYEQVKSSLTPKVEEIKTQIQSALTPKIDKIKAQLESQIESLKTEMQSQMEAMKNDLKTQADVVKTGISEVKGLVQNEIQQGVERHQGALGAVSSKISEEVNTVHKQVTQAVGDIHSALNHTVKQNYEKVTNSVMEAKGKAIAKSVDSMLRLFGQTNADGSMTYESKSFNFHKQGNNISITAKDGRPVMVEGDLTTAATESDVESLNKVETVVHNYLKPQAPSHSQSSKLRR
ncbi:hypothetical protein ACN23B_30095 (plasmid) [Anabaena sp. FACHB-709]|uniref:Uncharacterized protein n=2 Tax=Nostocaceae TaxID=1162 RepID=A0A1Z4KWE6_ANAVA|nr:MULTISPECIES: hypothetical protein [Nostocaceae]BAY73212.1 hypothetical protein NIES23_60400 [Trichormus variabilis NIES-23]HBW32494.1 hypothetical protein [Nostoc sp. UBA8866]MBD2175189.1 hypothetical protein [Anabaena cylindrica FACHB-318]MBD2266230.1 hypothetical protein [Anabaena sp. FACHB-709]MBD2275961.1 hypothetical protein [Nostoc sp. PCC 7120 = FACHB-418]